jgi:hypothetical protein
MKWSINMFFRAMTLKHLIGVCALLVVAQAQAQETSQAYDGPLLGEPEYKVTDGNHVNVAGSAISYSMSDLSIGSGALSLSHSISINNNDLLNWDAYYPGYKEKYQGGIRRIIYSRKNTDEIGNIPFEVVSVSDDVTTTNFIITEDGEFEGLKDQLSTLTVVDNTTYMLTRPDGTEVRFNTEGTGTIPSPLTTAFYPRAYMSEITYPNGFIITIHKDGDYMDSPIKSVTSNNGLQLKYVYERHTRPLVLSKQGATIIPDMPSDSNSWSKYHPVKIIALNNAVETCPLLSDTCEPTHDWPEVNYAWPDGMPRDFYIGDSVFTVTDAEERVTEFHSKALSKGYENGIDGTANFPNLVGNYYPRIVKIINSMGSEVDYGYLNHSTATSSPPWIFRSLSQHGVLRSSKNNNVSTSYTFGQLMVEYQASGTKKMSASSTGGYKGVERVVKTFIDLSGEAPGKILTAPFIIETWDKDIYIKEDVTEQVARIENKLNGTTTYYEYDTKGRVEVVDFDGIKTKAIFPASYCSPKNCNKPSQVSNQYNAFLGASPVYTSTQYSFETGQILSVKYPANNVGKIAQTEYSYQDYYARYIDDSGSLTSSLEPISLLASQFSCKNSNVSNGNCSGNDKITTNYEYGSGAAGNNLFLIGQTVTTQGETKVYTTCFQYDKYGNQIGQSQPKAGIADCNAGRGY